MIPEKVRISAGSSDKEKNYYAAMRYYIDTCIWIDYLENRQDRFRPLGDWAFKLIRKIIAEESSVFISDHLRNELSRYGGMRAFEALTIVPEQIIIRIQAKRKHIFEAKQLAKKYEIPFGDALHAVLANANKCVLVSRDKHFRELQKYIRIRTPEELI